MAEWFHCRDHNMNIYYQRDQLQKFTLSSFFRSGMWTSIGSSEKIEKLKCIICWGRNLSAKCDIITHLSTNSREIHFPIFLSVPDNQYAGVSNSRISEIEWHETVGVESRIFFSINYWPQHFVEFLKMLYHFGFFIFKTK